VNPDYNVQPEIQYANEISDDQLSKGFINECGRSNGQNEIRQLWLSMFNGIEDRFSRSPVDFHMQSRYASAILTVKCSKSSSTSICGQYYEHPPTSKANGCLNSVDLESILRSVLAMKHRDQG
jgi:hypothetical protein